MANQHNQAAVAVDAADEEMVKTLEQTLVGRVLKGLQGPLDEVVHNAVRSAILVAANSDNGATPKAKPEISRPAAGGRCAKVWDTLDKMSAEGDVPSLQQIRKEARRRRWNKSTATIQYYRWRNAHGITRNSAKPSGEAAQAAQ
jgi:hypothetical protein